MPSHNETYPHNFIFDRKAMTMLLVDWEYSGNNVPGWDLAFLSVSSKLSQAQDKTLLSAYVDNKMAKHFYAAKPVVAYMLAVWSATQLAYAKGPSEEKVKEQKFRDDLKLVSSNVTTFFSTALKISPKKGLVVRLPFTQEVPEEERCKTKDSKPAPLQFRC